MTSDVSTQPLSNRDDTISSTFAQEHLQIAIPTPRHDKYIQPDTFSMPPPQTYVYNLNIRNRNVCTQPGIPSSERDTFDHIKVGNYEMSRDIRREIDASEHISDRLCKTAQLMRKPKFGRNKESE